MLQPSATDQGELKYDMRVIAQNVEYYSLMRDLEIGVSDDGTVALPFTPNGDLNIQTVQSNVLRDSLWYFDGSSVAVWSDVQDILSPGTMDFGRELPAAVEIHVDFYPLCTLVSKGITFGIEPELVQRRDLPFAFWRFATRVSYHETFQDRNPGLTASRLTYFFHHYYDIILLSTTLLLLFIFRTDTGNYHIFRMLSKFFYMTCLTKKWRHHHYQKKLCCPVCSHSYRRSRSILTS